MSLFTPVDPRNTTRLFRFLHEVNEKHGLKLDSYQDLYHWSISNIDLFWSHVWDHAQIIGDKGNRIVDTTATPAKNPAWFPDSASAVNFAENLLFNRSTNSTAIVQVCTFLQPNTRLERLGNKLHVQPNRLPRTPSLSPPAYRMHSCTHSWRTQCPVFSSMDLSLVIASHHTLQTA